MTSRISDKLPDPVRPGDAIGHYTIEDAIGAGGMGEVWLAVDSRLHRKVAIKVIQKTGTGEDDESAARLLREARVAASLTHPNIVSVFDVGEHEGHVFLAMEYVVGKTLREYVKNPEEPAWGKRVRWLLDIARALAAAHKKGLVHRDIKPENIMVRDDDGLIKVLDFGIARRTVAEPADPTAQTQHASFATGKGQISGTPMYMAPEQIKGGAPDARSDQFAWGIVAFELLAGRRPWPEKNDLLAMVACVLTEPPASLGELAPELPAPIHEVIQRAIARDPRDRFTTMDEAVEALELHVTGSGTSSRTSGAPVKDTTKKSVAVPSGVELKRVSGRTFDPEVPKTGAGMVTERSLGAEPPPPPPPRTKKRLVIAALALGCVASGYWYWRGTLHPVKPVKPVASNQIDAGAPKPATDNPEAARLYGEGVQLWRDGAWIKARKSLEEAAAKDPGFASPNLLLALLEMASDRIGAAREPYQRALVQRGKLSDMERALLDAMDPALQNVEPDFEEAEKRAKAHTDKDNKDVASLYWLGWVRAQRDDFEGAQKAFERAIRVDPLFVPARRGSSRALVDLGRPDQARKELDECIKTSPSAAICIRDRMWLADRAGNCADMENDARSWSAVEPDASEPDYQLAVALAAEGQARDSVATALRRQWSKMSTGERHTQEPSDQADLAVFSGDFTAAERFAHAWEGALSADADVLEHAGPELLRAHLAFEEGDNNAAADIADAFEKRMKGYPQRLSGPDPSLDFDELLYRGNRITKAELDVRRTAWLARMESKESQKEKQRRSGVRWATVYAGFAEKIDEAKEALDKQNDFQPMPPDTRAPLEFAANVGKVYALAGKADDAIPYLERVTKSCSALKNPAIVVRASFFLGMAYETKGELDGARKAYKAVVDRWGAAKPKSMTAEKAKEQLARLGP